MKKALGFQLLALQKVAHLRKKEGVFAILLCLIGFFRRIVFAEAGHFTEAAGAVFATKSRLRDILWKARTRGNFCETAAARRGKGVVFAEGRTMSFAKRIAREIAKAKKHMNTYVLTFASTHAAMASSKTLASGGIDFWTIPTPREISAGCGIALRFEADDPEEVVSRIFGSAANRTVTGRAALYLQVQEKEFEKASDL